MTRIPNTNLVTARQGVFLFTRPGFAAHLRDLRGRLKSELAVIVKAPNASWQRCLAAGLVLQIHDNDPTKVRSVVRMIDLIIENDEVRQRQRRVGD